MSLLDVCRVSKSFGGVQALEEVGLEVDEGEVVGLIGPNGSGKTTLINVLSGVYAPDTGTVRLGDETVVGLRPFTLVERGMARTFQSARVFQTVTVWQNMMVPVLHTSEDGGVLAERAERLLSLVELEEHADRAASELSGGQQRLLEFARAMMSAPRVVLMDEPFAGVHPEIKQTLLASVGEAQRSGTTFVIVSHELPVISDVADRLVCLAGGRVIAAGEVDEVVEAPAVVDAYLGHSRDRDSPEGAASGDGIPA